MGRITVDANAEERIAAHQDRYVVSKTRAASALIQTGCEYFHREVTFRALDSLEEHEIWVRDNYYRADAVVSLKGNYLKGMLACVADLDGHFDEVHFDQSILILAEERGDLTQLSKTIEMIERQLLVRHEKPAPVAVETQKALLQE